VPAGALTDWLQELAENFSAEFGGFADQFVGLTANGGSITTPAVGFQVFQVLGQVQPAIDQSFIQLEVALQSVCIAPVSKSLVSTSWRFGKVYSALRHIKGVAMPLKHRVGSSERTKNGIG
jgi:hypothetical protein